MSPYSSFHLNHLLERKKVPRLRRLELELAKGLPSVSLPLLLGLLALKEPISSQVRSSYVDEEPPVVVGDLTPFCELGHTFREFMRVAARFCRYCVTLARKLTRHVLSTTRQPLKHGPTSLTIGFRAFCQPADTPC